MEIKSQEEFLGLQKKKRLLVLALVVCGIFLLVFIATLIISTWLYFSAPTLPKPQLSSSTFSTKKHEGALFHMQDGQKYKTSNNTILNEDHLPLKGLNKCHLTYGEVKV